MTSWSVHPNEPSRPVPSWINRRDRMTTENISRSMSIKECCVTRWRSNLRPPDYQSDPRRPTRDMAFFSTLSWLIDCVEVLQPSQPNGVMSSAVSLPYHTFTEQTWSSKRLTSIVHILSPETDNRPSGISRRERMTVENISWSISTKECCWPQRGLNQRPLGLQWDGASNWATEAGHSFLIFF